MGVSSEIGTGKILRSSRTFSGETSNPALISSLVGSRPYSVASRRLTRSSLLILSVIWTGIRIVRALSATEPFHKAVDGPHWYLVAVGTRPERQGQGLGSALLEVGTSQADAVGLPCYQEYPPEWWGSSMDPDLR